MLTKKVFLERRALQAVVIVAALVPLSAGGAGMALGISAFTTVSDISLDSHVRYLSGLLFAIGLCFWSMVPAIETRTAPVRLLTFIVFIGGLARLAGALLVGLPSTGMILAIGMELIVTPLLCLWQGRIAGLFTNTASRNKTDF